MRTSSATIRKCQGEKITNSVILLAFGANLPVDVASGEQLPAETIALSLVDLSGAGFRLRRFSRLYATPCFPSGTGPDYVNAAAVFEAGPDLTPDSILAALHRVEAAHGRRRSTRWAGRTLDIDLLAIGDTVRPDLRGFLHWQRLAPVDQARLAPDRLILPHPRLAERAFVLVPLAEVAPDWRHPVLGQTVAQMRDALPPADLAAIHLL
ncbi:2-amino-4-hydroxy-6-hydroxymethyldihydropteridine diphosphokinase [Pseudorhodobacter sp.]|uniref:2-amino-4-hydroxy-6- hydroxymethyldihydropteridine diphosphokinase n=1 Tax=Pseudorhodobacter sp. TaxID=1934400 RepID=UPI0026477BE1|nr:2-amino-4-hydroxy-6-hydroxymethyldihydropteridine diphosphokinase [Pseudorhodobacter sp.]MDN5787221.1 2-amino-4-hydroxy-6-hydroxymethyldihydropteridine diphosphokinase [Pseudorhodobacter sp.]